MNATRQQAAPESKEIRPLTLDESIDAIRRHSLNDPGVTYSLWQTGANEFRATIGRESSAGMLVAVYRDGKSAAL